MIERKLSGNDLIVPGDYGIGDMGKLMIYHRVFYRGGGDVLPPVVAVRYDASPGRKTFLDAETEKFIEWAESVKGDNPYAMKTAEAKIKELGRKYAALAEKAGSSCWCLIDGVHRSTAASLAGMPVGVLDLETDEDICRVDEMVRRGMLFHFPRDERSIEDLLYSFEEAVIERDHESTGPMSVSEMAEMLSDSGELPPYMSRVRSFLPI